MSGSVVLYCIVRVVGSVACCSYLVRFGYAYAYAYDYDYDYDYDYGMRSIRNHSPCLLEKLDHPSPGTEQKATLTGNALTTRLLIQQGAYYYFLSQVPC
jgi:hypothetical protein